MNFGIVTSQILLGNLKNLTVHASSGVALEHRAEGTIWEMKAIKPTDVGGSQWESLAQSIFSRYPPVPSVRLIRYNLHAAHHDDRPSERFA